MFGPRATEAATHDALTAAGAPVFGELSPSAPAGSVAKPLTAAQRVEWLAARVKGAMLNAAQEQQLLERVRNAEAKLAALDRENQQLHKQREAFHADYRAQFDVQFCAPAASPPPPKRERPAATLRELQHRLCDAHVLNRFATGANAFDAFACHVHNEIESMFVTDREQVGDWTSSVCGIRRKADGYWWECSSEHGAGWNDKRIRQAWTPRQAREQVRVMILHGTVRDGEVEIVELGPKGNAGAPAATLDAATKPLHAEIERLAMNLAACLDLAESRTPKDYPAMGDETPAVKAVRKLLVDWLQTRDQIEKALRTLDHGRVSVGTKSLAR